MSISRSIDPVQAHDLLRRVPRACIGFVGDDGPQAQPVALIWCDDRYRVGIPARATLRPAPGAEVVLLYFAFVDGHIWARTKGWPA